METFSSPDGKRIDVRQDIPAVVPRNYEVPVHRITAVTAASDFNALSVKQPSDERFQKGDRCTGPVEQMQSRWTEVVRILS
jgi:hypothetical protein